MQHRSRVWRRHSAGVHLSHIQKPIHLQHLQQQHEQHIHTMRITIVNITLPHVVTMKNVQISFSLLRESCLEFHLFLHWQLSLLLKIEC